jgi:ATP-dependent DNA helicase RecQ
MVPEVARPILRGEVPVRVREDAPALPRAPRTRRERRGAPIVAGVAGAGEFEADRAGTGARAAAPSVEPPPPGADLSLFEALRTWRASEAKAQAVPPYVIFHDTVLREISAVRPVGLGELGEIKGVGASKLARYGAAVLALVAAAP